MSTEEYTRLEDRIFQSLITSLSILKKNIGIYPPGHTTINRTSGQLLEILWEAFENSPSITIAATKKVLSINGGILESKTPHVQEFALFLNQRGIASLTLEKGLEARELQDFFRLALSIPQGTLLYQVKDIEKEINALEHILAVELDFSGAVLAGDDAPVSEIPMGRITSLWQDFMLGCLPEEQGEDAALPDTTKGYDRDSFRQFCLKYNVTPGRLLESYEKILKDVFSSVDEQVSGLAEKQAFLKAMQQAMADLAEELKNQLLAMTVGHMNEQEDEAAVEEMLFSMPGEMILEAFQKASGDKKEISPALTKLLGSMARAQEQEPENGKDPSSPAPQLDAATRQKIQKLLSKENYEEYVPEDYSDILQKVSAGLMSSAPEQAVDFDVEQHLPSLQDERLNRDVIVALLAIMDSDIEAGIYADFSARLALGIADLMHAREYGLLVDIYKRLVRHVSDKRDPAARNAAAAAVDAFSQERCIALLAEAFSTQAAGLDTELEELVLLTGTRNLGWLIKQYVQLYTTDRGQKLFAMLGRFGVRAAEEAITILPDCNDLQAIALLRLIRANGDNSCIQAVRRLLDSDSADVRLEALRTLLKIKDAAAVPVLKKMLYARDRRSMERALLFVQENDVRELAPDLAEMIKTLFISRDSLVRNKAFLAVLGSLGNSSVLPVLQKKAYTRFSFTPVALHQTQYFLYKSLAGYPRNAVEGLVQKGLHSRTPGVRRACQEILNSR